MIRFFLVLILFSGFFITISNAQCTAIISSTTDITCPGGSNGTATASMTGGSPPFTYNWSNGSISQTATGLAIGTFGVTISDTNGCLDSTSTDIELSPNAISATVDTTIGVQCTGESNGSATVMGLQGTPPYLYSWSNGNSGSTANGLPEGTYSVTVSDWLLCATVVYITITEPAALLSIGLASKTNPTCYGYADGTAALLVSGGEPPYSYSWANGDSLPINNQLTAGIHSVTVTDNAQCLKTANISLLDPPGMNLTLTSLPPSSMGICDGEATVNASSGNSPYSFLWDDSLSQSTSTATGLCQGIYTVTVTDATPCSLTQQITVGNSTGVQAIDLRNNLNLFPNPTYHKLHLIVEKKTRLVASRIDGRIVFDQNLKLGDNILNINEWKPGPYILNLYSENDRIIKKIVKL